MSLSILIFGAGAIGSFIGGHMAAAGHQVTLLGRPEGMRKISREGLTIFWPDRAAIEAFPKTVSTNEQLSPPYDFIFLTVKAPDTPRALAQLADLPLSKKAYIVSFQNGLGNEEQIATAFGPKKCMAGTVTIPIQMLEQGRLEVSKAKGGLGVAPLDASQPGHALAEALNQAGLITEVYADYRAMKWSKLLLNIVNNASSAILGQPPAQIIENPALFNLEIEALGEGVQVMKAQDIPAVKLPGYSVQWLARLVGPQWLPLLLKRTMLRPFMLSGRGSKMPSLYLDLAAGRSTSEIQALNGAIVQAGQKFGLPMPVNRTLTAILSDLVSGQVTWSDYKDRPQKLIQAVQEAKSSHSSFKFGSNV